MTNEGTWLRMGRRLPARRDEVWSALTDSAKLVRWWGPKGFTVPSVDWEARTGNTYRIAMQPPDGEMFHIVGEFKEVDPPAQLAFTFVYDQPAPDDRETLATLSLEGRGDHTTVELSLGEFATEERRALHEGGWSDSFERLEELLRA